jgi:hypothetical protein
MWPIASRANGWLDGSWEGVVKLGRASYPFDNAAERKIRIQVAGDAVRVFLYEGQKPVELEPGRFHIMQGGTGTLIYASGEFDVWPHKNQMETITFVVTRLANDHLLAEYARVGYATGGEILAEWTRHFGEHGEGELSPSNDTMGDL